VVRDDKLELVGFATEPERTLFRHLVSVSGIGPAVALQVLSRATVTQFVAAVCQEDRAYLSAIKGVGKKTVDRILVELAEPLRKWGLLDETAPDEAPAVSPLRDEAVRALGTLGLNPSAARRAVEKAEKRLGPGAPLEEMVKAALTEV
jgi:Holliday junction DNA helicase RuvA